KILKEKAFNSDIDESWKEWAIEMIQANFEAESLYELAGISEPFNQFKLHDLAENVFKDLNLDYSDSKKVISNYIHCLISSSVDKPERYLETLKIFKDICSDSEMDSDYMDFYLLYFAKVDLSESGIQWYW